MLSIFPADGRASPNFVDFWARSEPALLKKAKGILAWWEEVNGCSQGSALLTVWLYPTKAEIAGKRPRRPGREAPVFNTV
jgi:hypothetical protein